MTKFKDIKPNHPSYVKQYFDLSNTVFKTQVRVGLKIEEKIFAEMKTRNKDGRMDDQYYGYYIEVVKKP